MKHIICRVPRIDINNCSEGAEMEGLIVEEFINRYACYEYCLICGFCNELSDLVDYDYVTKPMLWCNGCGSRSILDLDLSQQKTNEGYDLSTMEKISDTKTRNLLDNMKCKYNPYNLSIEEIKRDSTELFYVPSLYITRVIGDNMMRYRATREIGQENINEVLNSHYMTEKNYIWGEFDKNLMEKYGVVKIKKTGDEDDNDDEDADDSDDENSISSAIQENKMTEELAKFAAVCNSYDAEQPQNEYPKGVDLSHDGIYVAVETVKNGVKKWEMYWGD